MEEAHLRIGEIARRLGATPEALRAWETRYGVVSPKRSGGGLRLYTSGDERRLRLMVAHIASGVPASEAARLASIEAPGTARPPGADLGEIGGALAQSFEALDEPLAQATLDELLATASLQTALSEVILPLLREIGSRWAAGQVTIAHEHFASNVIDGRLRAMAKGWGRGVGPLVLLACPPGERHELSLLGFGLVLREQGWRISYLGADTPLSDIARSTSQISPALVALSATVPARFLEAREEITALAALVRVAIGGAGATRPVAAALGVERLEDDVISAAASLLP